MHRTTPARANPGAIDRSPGGALRAWLGDGRWHGQHGPIDVIVQAEGEPAAVAAAHDAAWHRLQGLLAELVAELPLLKQPVPQGPGPTANPLHGPVACAMWQACQPLARQYLTPMAAVAGAVADALIAAYQRPGIRRAWVNNGGDIALHLAPGSSARVGLVVDPTRPPGPADRNQPWGPADSALSWGPADAALPWGPAGVALPWEPADADAAAGARPPLDGQFTLHAAQPVRGVATSGWRGRSFSLGVADSVTVLAATAAQADAAATVIANAVDVAAPGIVRQPASALKDDSDLGDIPVTVQVPPLGAGQQRSALQRGLRVAQALQRQGLIHAAFLVCQQHALRCAPLPGTAPAAPAASAAAAAAARAPALARSLLSESPVLP